MPATLSTLRSHSQKWEKEQRKTLEQLWKKPPIPFQRPGKKKAKSDSDEEDDTYTKTFNIPLNPDATDETAKKETYSVKLHVFETGTPEDWCEWRTEAEDFFEAEAYNDTAIQVKIYNVGQTLKSPLLTSTTSSSRQLTLESG